MDDWILRQQSRLHMRLFSTHSWALCIFFSASSWPGFLRCGSTVCANQQQISHQSRSNQTPSASACSIRTSRGEVGAGGCRLIRGMWVLIVGKFLKCEGVCWSASILGQCRAGILKVQPYKRTVVQSFRLTQKKTNKGLGLSLHGSPGRIGVRFSAHSSPLGPDQTISSGWTKTSNRTTASNDITSLPQ